MPPPAPPAARRWWPGRVLAVVAVLAVAVAGLVLGARPVTLPAPGREQPAPAATPSPAAEPAPTTPAPPLAGLHVVLDPGHNGGNAAAAAEIAAPVDDGRGGTKPCNTVGTATVGGYPEHAFTLDVALRARDLLEADGAQVTLTRTTDDGVGPCVDARGRAAQEAGADVLVSLHANGSPSPEPRGYFAIVAAPPVHDAQGTPSRELAAALLDALAAAGFPPSSLYPGALSERPDMATLNHSQRPAVLLELAEMRNPEEAALTESPEGRTRYAAAVVEGLRAWAGQASSAGGA
ncbi:N-acetylmuramoyl-L-alanine amidase [Georgenia sp. TF02-10]|uniref:N-acetylmuramoyl-L-alanine amidase n=1 Tax=Georgenia sp. TF02-10 TaxID=2917725 RepID=UPI001FA771B8|nr:N-acetylmuramoyl-L-alanine amidase [Georgenia sp. TF02-10]UNX54702.1 N-acetylmuramoyl-L-alanine amidase [Georgenia sp. TF02-10]